MANWFILRSASRKHPRSPDHRSRLRAIRVPTHHARRPHRLDRFPVHPILRCQYPNAPGRLPLARCRLISLFTFLQKLTPRLLIVPLGYFPNDVCLLRRRCHACSSPTIPHHLRQLVLGYRSNHRFWCFARLGGQRHPVGLPSKRFQDCRLSPTDLSFAPRSRLPFNGSGPSLSSSVSPSHLNRLIGWSRRAGPRMPRRP